MTFKKSAPALTAVFFGILIFDARLEAQYSGPNIVENFDDESQDPSFKGLHPKAVKVDVRGGNRDNGRTDPLGWDGDEKPQSSRSERTARKKTTPAKNSPETTNVVTTPDELRELIKEFAPSSAEDVTVKESFDDLVVELNNMPPEATLTVLLIGGVIIAVFAMGKQIFKAPDMN